MLARFLRSRVPDLFPIEIHPAAKIGHSVFIGYGSYVVIGETAVVGDDFSMLHNMPLGGTGSERGSSPHDRPWRPV